MRANQFRLRKNSWLVVPVFLASIVLTGLFSCSGGKGGAEPTLSSDASCLTLEGTQLNDWFPRYSRPTEPEANKITVIKFYATPGPQSSLQVVVRGFNSANAQVGRHLQLNPGMACAVNLPPYLIGQSFDVTLSDWNILNTTTGRLVDGFNKIVLRPAVYKHEGMGPDLLKFDADILIGDAPPQEKFVLPCPPCWNCKPRDPTCILIDSTVNKTGITPAVKAPLDTAAHN
jgi:hypothetical protein